MSARALTPHAAVTARTALTAARLLLDALTLDTRAVSKAVATLEHLAAQDRAAPVGELEVLTTIGGRYRAAERDHCAECGEVWPCTGSTRRDVRPADILRHRRARRAGERRP